MNSTLIVGLDGGVFGERALAYAKRLAKLIGECHIEVVYVIEWSPYRFQTAEENAKRGADRKKEVAAAKEHVVDPALALLKAEGYAADGRVKHGSVAEILNNVAVDLHATQIIVGRSSDNGFAARLFGSSTANLVMSASVPVTVVS